MAMKTSAQKAAEKDMWERIFLAMSGDAEVQELCAKMLEKYAPTEAELFALDLYKSFAACEKAGVYHTCKEWAEIAGVGKSDSRRVVSAVTRLVKDGKMLKAVAEGSKVGAYCLA